MIVCFLIAGLINWGRGVQLSDTGHIVGSGFITSFLSVIVITILINKYVVYPLISKRKEIADRKFSIVILIILIFCCFFNQGGERRGNIIGSFETKPNGERKFMWDNTAIQRLIYYLKFIISLIAKSYQSQKLICLK